MKCGYCKKEGHNKRTCIARKKKKKEVLKLHNNIVEMLININNKIIDLNKRS